MTQQIRDFDQAGARRDGKHAGGRKQRYVLNESARRLMQCVYGNPEYGNVSESIDYLQERLGFPRNIIKDRAKQMGLARIKDPYWTPEDLAYLEENYQRPAGKRASIASIAKHLGRTESAIRLKAKRMKYRRTQGDTYTVRALADALGCDWHKVERWIEHGWLDAPIDASRDNGQRAIKASDIRRFIIEHPSEIDHRRADWIWLLDILVGDKERLGGPEQRGRKAQ